MSPPPAFGHASLCRKIIRCLNELLPDGRALPETPVLTADGIKVPDVTWIGPEYAGELEAGEATGAGGAPRKSAFESALAVNSRPK